MKMLRRIAGYVTVASLGATVASAQTVITVHPEAGAGFEHITGGQYDGRLGAMETAGGEVWIASSNPSLMFTFGARAEYHSGPGAYVAPFGNPGGGIGVGMYAPNLFGGQEIAGARYMISSRLTIGAGVGFGYLTNTDRNVGTGSSMRSVQGDVSYVMTDHITMMARAEQYQMPNYGAESRPVSLLMRFR